MTQIAYESEDAVTMVPLRNSTYSSSSEMGVDTEYQFGSYNQVSLISKYILEGSIWISFNDAI